MEIVESLNDDVERGRTCGMVGNAFYLLEDGKQAQPYYLKVIIGFKTRYLLLLEIFWFNFL